MATRNSNSSRKRPYNAKSSIKISTLTQKMNERGLAKRPVLSEIQREALKIEMCRFFQRKEFTVYKETFFKDLFETDRDYRADFYLTKGDLKILIEINGGQNVKGRHTSAALSASSFPIGYRATNYENDLIKINLAQTNGYIVLQYTYEMLYFQQYEKDFKNL